MVKSIPREQLTVVITGASSGFGQGVARQLAAQGASVVIAARRTELLDQLVDELGPNVIACTADVSSEEDIARLYDTAMSAFGRIDVWINNAGVGLIGPYTELPPADLKRLVEINILGVMYGSHYALRQFKQQGHGVLINLGSIVSKVPFPYYGAYGATKYAVAGLSAALNHEMQLEHYDDIHVCTVHPWATDTPWFEHTGNYSGHRAEMKPMDDAQHVIDAIIDLIDKPQENVEVGVKSKGTTLSSNLLPGLTENFNAKYVQKVIQSAPAAGSTSGSLHQPLQTGKDVSGGNRERMKRESDLPSDPTFHKE
ncbi:SDR family NAD(P)-dependent oxidoreductase [Paenibacillus kandeliae]|uniref:SDR family NAD(P)-dependent oxidoreductase n=1 Tax=Paenibacillus kandeliae TaxID=3231269 RepID=UPI003457E354